MMKGVPDGPGNLGRELRLADLQDAIRATYVDRDRERGLLRTFMWLVEEIGELARAINSGCRDEAAIRHEVSDVLAWLLSVATLLEVDVADVALRFADGCPKCGAAPCVCPERSCGE